MSEHIGGGLQVTLSCFLQRTEDILRQEHLNFQTTILSDLLSTFIWTGHIVFRYVLSQFSMSSSQNEDARYEFMGVSASINQQTNLQMTDMAAQWDVISFYAPSNLWMSTLLNRSVTSQSSGYPIVLTRLRGPSSRPNLIYYSCSEKCGTYHVIDCKRRTVSLTQFCTE